ncbi:MAG: hypothetical protein J0M08_12020 [Bacteroidetes bacterium]|nr:hypothetical protein [Bacteroidota bacterium]
MILDYYPFGSYLTNRNFNRNEYPNSFNGKREDNELFGWQDYGFRNYMKAARRFDRHDELFINKKYPELSPFQFAGNSPILAIDVDGLEPEAINEGVEVLVIVVHGKEANPPKTNQTQVKNNPAATSSKNDLNILSDLEKNQPFIQVVQYSSSEGTVTKDDIKQTIKNLNSINPNAKLILVGHSLGADNLVELVKENPEIKVDRLYTIDISSPGWDDSDIPSNVNFNINYYQSNFGEAGGEETSAQFGNENSVIENIKVKNTSHRTIDSDVSGTIFNQIKNIVEKKNPAPPPGGSAPSQD